MNCIESNHFLHRYIDEEFDEREKIEYEYHLIHCDLCRAELEYYRALRLKMQESLPREMPPLHLEGRISASLRSEDLSPPLFSKFSLSFAVVFVSVVAFISLWPSLTDVFPSSNLQDKSWSPITQSSSTNQQKHNILPRSSFAQSQFVARHLKNRPFKKNSRRHERSWRQREQFPTNKVDKDNENNHLYSSEEPLISPLFVGTAPSKRQQSLFSQER